MFRATTRFCLLMGALLSLAGCPGDDAPTCQDCTPGAATCEGNYTVICNGDGKGFRYNACGSAQYCLNGACQTRACSNLGGGSCVDTSTLTQCDNNGTAQTTVTCGASEVCAGGACVAAACTDGDVRCGDPYSVITCTGGAWTEEVCSGGQICGDDPSGAKACVAATCTANSARCDGNVSVVCDHTGATESRTTCGGNEVCDSGFCRTKICGEVLTTPDASADQTSTPDTTGDVPGPEPDIFRPPLEPNPVLKFTLNNVAKDYNLNVRADYITTEKTLKIQGARSGEKIEINLTQIEPRSLGMYTDTDSTEVVVQICYFDGINGDEVAPCAVGFSHASIGYTVDVTDNNGPGSRVKGTFSAVLKDINEQNVTIEAGEFDVKHF